MASQIRRRTPHGHDLEESYNTWIPVPYWASRAWWSCLGSTRPCSAHLDWSWCSWSCLCALLMSIPRRPSRSSRFWLKHLHSNLQANRTLDGKCILLLLPYGPSSSVFAALLEWHHLYSFWGPHLQAAHPAYVLSIHFLWILSPYFTCQFSSAH